MTAQLLDSLYLEQNPTEYFVMDFISLPKIRSKKWRHFQKIPDQDFAESLVCSTCCWRRYAATWRVVENKLYLAEVFGKYKLLQPLHAVWITQTIRIREGEFLFDALRDDDDTFDYKIDIKNGEVLVVESG